MMDIEEAKKLFQSVFEKNIPIKKSHQEKLKKKADKKFNKILKEIEKVIKREGSYLWVDVRSEYAYLVLRKLKDVGYYIEEGGCSNKEYHTVFRIWGWTR